MKLNAGQLERHLKGTLSLVYVVSGDDPLLTQEAAEQIRQAADQQGFSERQILNVDAHFDWDSLLEANNSLSLFAERRLLELRIPTGKPSEAGTQALLEYLTRPNPDNLLLISLPRLDGPTQRTRWAKALQENPQVQFLSIWPLEAQQLPRWIQQRLNRVGLSATPEAIDLIATRVEGNLLAAAQEIEKLALLAEQKHLDLAFVQAAVSDSARYTPFDLVDAMLHGDLAHALRILNGLRSEGTEAPIILWALARELRVLIQLSQGHERGIPMEQTVASIKPPVWDKRRPLLIQAAQRHRFQAWNQLLLSAQSIDAQIKGQQMGCPWLGLSQLLFSLCGKPL